MFCFEHQPVKTRGPQPVKVSDREYEGRSRKLRMVATLPWMARYWRKNPTHKFTHKEIKDDGWIGERNPVMKDLDAIFAQSPKIQWLIHKVILSLKDDEKLLIVTDLRAFYSYHDFEQKRTHSLIACPFQFTFEDSLLSNIYLYSLPSNVTQTHQPQFNTCNSITLAPPFSDLHSLSFNH